MKEKIKVIRMVCGMLWKKNTGIILCRDSKNGLLYVNGKGKDIVVEIAEVMGKDENIRKIFASGVLMHILADGSVPALNETGLLNLKKILEKIIAEGCARRNSSTLKKRKTGRPCACATIRKEAGMNEPTIADLKKEAWRYAEQDWRAAAGKRQKLTRKDALRIAYFDGILRGMRIRKYINPG